MDAFNQPKPRVNGSMLPKHQGSIVCLLGLLKNVSYILNDIVVKTDIAQCCGCDLRKNLRSGLNYIIIWDLGLGYHIATQRQRDARPMGMSYHMARGRYMKPYSLRTVCMFYNDLNINTNN